MALRRIGLGGRVSFLSVLSSLRFRTARLRRFWLDCFVLEFWLGHPLNNDSRRRVSLTRHSRRNEPKEQTDNNSNNNSNYDFPGWLVLPVALATLAILTLCFP